MGRAVGRRVGTGVGRLEGFAVGAYGSTTQRTPAPNSHMCPGQHVSGRLGPVAPQPLALSPATAQTAPSGVVDVGVTIEASVQKTFWGPGWHTKPLQHLSGRSAAGRAPQEVALIPSVPQVGAAGRFWLPVHVTFIDVNSTSKAQLVRKIYMI